MNRKLLGVLATLSAPLLAAGCATTAPTEQASGGFPDSLDAITMVVGFSAGGSTDTVARLVAPILEAELGKPVQVLNKPEGNGQIALQELADAPTNGSVVGSVNLPSVFTSYLDPNTDVNYDRASFTPIGAVTNFGTVLVTSADSPYKTLDDLADAVKSEPDTVNLAAGAVDDLLPVSNLEKALGGTFNQIPYEGGSAGKVTALLGKKVDVILAAPSAVVGNVQSGDLRILSNLGSQRSVTFPDVSTATESGYDVVEDTINGFALPAGTPQEIIDAYTKGLEKAVAHPAFVAAVNKLGFGADYLTPTEHGALWDKREAAAAPIIAQAQ